MFKKALERDLKAIFKVKKIVFQRIENALEQNILYVEISSAKTTVRRGAEFATVRGRIGIAGPLAGNPFGFFHKKLEDAPNALEKRFHFGKTEWQSENLPGWEIKTQTIDFIYFYANEYYPVKGFITGIKWIFNYIKGAIKQ